MRAITQTENTSVAAASFLALFIEGDLTDLPTYAQWDAQFQGLIVSFPVELLNDVIGTSLF